jgi:uncharacterized protein YndB with AHSA1/START domain
LGHDEVREHVDGTQRTVTVDGRARRTMTLRRRYRAGVEDVWQACTDPERLARWLTPVSGDLRLGGRFQLQGNAGGEILRCEPPRELIVTWESPGDQPVTQVEVVLAAAEDGGTDLELRHGGPVDPAFWAQFGPGAVGVGWDLALYALGRVLAGEERPDQTAGPGSEPYRALVAGSSQSWQAAAEAAGLPAAEAKAAAERTSAFYAPPAAELQCWHGLADAAPDVSDHADRAEFWRR